MSQPTTTCVVVTGLGLVTPVGEDAGVLCEALRCGATAVGSPQSFDGTLVATSHCAEVPTFDDTELFPRYSWKYDRGTRMAAVACRSALRDAGLLGAASVLNSAGLCVGLSGGGQFQNMFVEPRGDCVVSRRAAHYHARNLPHFQTSVLSERFGLQGPVLTFCNASASGAIALTSAVALVVSGRVDVVVVGASEGLTLMNALTLHSLGVSLDQACQPFSGKSGITVGEGAAFIVLEGREHARGRGAKVLADILSSVVTSDAYDPVMNDPAGSGLKRAFRGALQQANLAPNQLDWIRACGTGSRVQDRAETLALLDVYGQSDQMPHVASTEGVLGHANGAAGLIGLSVAIMCSARRALPPASHLDLRPGDVGPSQRTPPRPRVVASCAIGFGGSNVVTVAALPGVVAKGRDLRRPRIGLLGMGAVTPFGAGLACLREALRRGSSALTETRLEGVPGPRMVACVPESVMNSISRSLPAGRRRSRLVKLAMMAAKEALASPWVQSPVGPGKTALVVALNFGAVESQQALYSELCHSRQNASTGRKILEMSRFSLVSDLCKALAITGYSTSLSAGLGGSLAALECASDLLASDPSTSYVVVVAADELSSMLLRMCHHLGVLAEGAPVPYGASPGGLALAEGAVAIVVGRIDEIVATNRTAGAFEALSPIELLGSATTSDAAGFWQVDKSGAGLARAIDKALRDAGAVSEEIGTVYGSGRGMPDADTRELAALAQAFGVSLPPVVSLVSQLGVAPASSGLLSVAAAALSFGSGMPLRPVAQAERSLSGAEIGHSQRLLAINSTEDGVNSAVVLGQASGYQALSS